MPPGHMRPTRDGDRLTHQRSSHRVILITLDRADETHAELPEREIEIFQACGSATM
jgi:hypothetical protein